MKVLRSVAAVSAAALIGTGAYVLPALASPQSTTHTLSFISVTKKMIGFTKTSFGAQNTDVNKAGKTIGFDEIYGAASSATSASANATLDTKGGMLYATFTISLKTGKITKGKVTGGTGAFKGATGSLTAKVISSTKTAVTITYHT